jgi:hypothetical protein
MWWGEENGEAVVQQESLAFPCKLPNSHHGPPHVFQIIATPSTLAQEPELDKLITVCVIFAVPNSIRNLSLVTFESRQLHHVQRAKAGTVIPDNVVLIGCGAAVA